MTKARNILTLKIKQGKISSLLKMNRMNEWNTLFYDRQHITFREDDLL